MSHPAAEFIDSMPLAYAEVFSAAEVEEHAGIVARRGSALVHVEASAVAGGPVVCVVADDQPGLLSLVTEALLVHGLDIGRAEVYCRSRPDGVPEAVDFFWLGPGRARHASLELEASTLGAFTETLCDLIAEHQRVSRTSDVPSSPPSRPRSRVFFDLVALRRQEYVLVVETPDFPGLLFAVTNALSDQGLCILHSEIRTEDGIARDRFAIAGPGGELLEAESLCDVQAAVRDAVRAAEPR